MPPSPTAPRTAPGLQGLRRTASQSSMLIPGTVLLFLLALLPMLALVIKGFTSPGAGLTLQNFRTILGSDTYVILLLKTLGLAFVVTATAMAIGWPAAWALAKHTSARWRSLLLGFIAVPYISSQLLLIYGFITLVQAGGPIMSILTRLGLAGPQDSIMYTSAATLAMLIYESIPTAVLLLYSASEQVDGAMLEASRSLGAGRIRTFFGVVWPLSSAVVIANFAITFVQTVGAFAEPAVLGGTRGQMLGNAISAQLNSTSGQELAVALSLVLLLSSLVVVGVVAGMVRASNWRPPADNSNRTTHPGAVRHQPIREAAR